MLVLLFPCIATRLKMWIVNMEFATEHCKQRLLHVVPL